MKTEIRRLFDIAASMSIAMDSSVDAETEMADFVQYIKSSDKHRSLLIELVRESFAEDFYMNWPPIELWRFCLHALRWPELLEVFVEYKRKDTELNGPARSNAWNYILEAGEPDWDAAQYFKSFR